MEKGRNSCTSASWLRSSRRVWRIELDLPLKAYFPLDEQPDRGLIPDVVVPESVDDVVRGVDAPLEAVRRLIAAAGP